MRRIEFLLFILPLAATAQNASLPNFSQIRTLTAGKDSPLTLTHDRQDEVLPGQIAIDCDVAGNCSGSAFAPIMGTVHEKSEMHYVWMHADGWNVLLTCREGWANRCAPLTENAEYDVRKWSGTQAAQLTGGPGPYGDVTIPATVEMAPQGKKKPKVKYDVVSLFKTISEGSPSGPRQVIFIDRSGVPQNNPQ